MKHIYIPELNILLDKETAFISTIVTRSFVSEEVVKKEGIFGFTFSKKEIVTNKIYSFVVGDHKNENCITEKSLIVLDAKWKIIADKIVEEETKTPKTFSPFVFDLAQRLGPNDIQKSKEEKCPASFKEAFEKEKGYKIEKQKAPLNTKKQTKPKKKKMK